MKAAFVVLVIVGILWGLYSGAMAAWSYFQISGVVEEVVPRELPKLTERDGYRSADRAKKLRESIVAEATKAGVTLAPASVTVSEEGRALSVQVNHPYTVVRLGEKTFDIPLSTSHSFTLPN